MKKLILAGSLAALSVFTPVSFNSAGAVTITTCEAGSCAPKCEWECIIDGMVRENRCDPNDYGCLSASLEADCDETGEVAS